MTAFLPVGGITSDGRKATTRRRRRSDSRFHGDKCRAQYNRMAAKIAEAVKVAWLAAAEPEVAP
jgi:hypothetical protein